MNIAELLQYGEDKLSSVGIETSALDSNLLLGNCLKKSRTQLFLDFKQDVDDDLQQVFYAMIDRRMVHEPISYIVGEREFFSLPFYVNEHVLIPRPETEFLLEKVLQKVAGKVINTPIIDLCCGSGVIGIILALKLKARIVSVDISSKAIDIAIRNSLRHKVYHLIRFVQGNLFSPFLGDQRFSLIVSNPPYISSHEVENDLDDEVSMYEPHLALDGGCKGMEIINKIYNSLPDMLAPGGDFFMEIGADQGKDVLKLFVNGQYKHLFETVDILQDYSNRDRVLHAKMVR